MRKLLFLISFVFVSLQLASQNTDFDYLKLSKPNTQNELSIHFKNSIPFRLLKKVNYPKGNYTINISFFINKLGEPYQINTSFRQSKELYDAIKKAFLEYPLEKLQLNSLDTKKRYSFQIIGNTVNYENIIYCSSIIIEETLPVCEPCKDLEYYSDIKNCINTEIKNYFNKNIDSYAVEIARKKNKNLKAKLKINKKGKLILLKGKNLDLYSETTKSFPRFETPATIQEKPIIYNYTFYPSKTKTPLQLNESDNLSLEENSTNNFTTFISERLDNKYIENSGLSRLNKKVMLSFQIDKKGVPHNIRTNARSYSLENSIISIFKEYPFKELDLGERSTLANYFTSILSYNKVETVVKTYKKFGEEVTPIFPGCEKSNRISDARKCFSKGVQRHFARTFDSKLPKRLGLSKGRKKIIIRFKVNNKGETEDISVQAPHPEIVDEVKHVMRRLPKITPGKQRGKPVNVKYTIPFTIVVN